MTTPFENFVNIALGKSLSADVTLPTADDIPVFTGIGRQVTGKTKAELGLALTANLGTAAAANVGAFDPAGSAATALSTANTYADTKQAALADVITAGDYGSSTQVPVITFNAKGIATTVNLATIAAPVLTEANFSVAKTGEPTYTVTWVLTALTAARAWTIPDTNLDFGNIDKIPAVATPYTTGAMAGTRPQCLGGSSNTFSGGTDVVAIGCTSSTLSGTNVTAINVTGLADSAITWANAIVLGSSYTTLPGQVGGGLNVLTNTTTIGNYGAGTYSAVSAAGAVSSSNCVKLALGVTSSAVHEIDFIIQHDNDYSNVGTITGKRRVIAFSDHTGAITVSSENTPYADFVMGSSTGLAFSVTLDTTNNRLIPTLTATGIGTIFWVAMQAKVTSYYTKKAA